MPGPHDVERFETHMSDSDALDVEHREGPAAAVDHRHGAVLRPGARLAPRSSPASSGARGSSRGCVSASRRRCCAWAHRTGRATRTSTSCTTCVASGSASRPTTRCSTSRAPRRWRASTAPGPLWEYTLVDGPRRRARRDGDEGPPLDDRRRRRHEAAAHALRLRARAGRAGPARRRRADPHLHRRRPRPEVARSPAAARVRHGAPRGHRRAAAAHEALARHPAQSIAHAAEVGELDRALPGAGDHAALAHHAAAHAGPLRSARSTSRSTTSSARARRSGGSLNDAFVAGVVGGLARYHEFHGEQVDDLRMVMPINLRDDGRRRSAATTSRPHASSCPLTIKDPAERIVALGARWPGRSATSRRWP